MDAALKTGTLIFMLVMMCHATLAPAQSGGELSIESGGETGDLASLWVERFRQLHPEVQISVTALGSGAGAPGMTQREYDVALMSRPFSEPELRSFSRHHDYQPTPLRVAHGAVLIYVAQTNPLQRLRMSQLDAVFSVSPRCSSSQPIRRWEQLGLSQRWLGHDIHLFGPDSATGVYDIFKQRALCGGDYRPDVQQLPGGTGVDMAVAAGDFSMGFAEMSVLVAGVKTLALSADDGKTFVEPTRDNILTGAYPLSHVIYLYLNQPPGRAQNPAARAFAAMVLSQQGQDAVSEIGLLPLSPADASDQLKRLP